MIYLAADHGGYRVKELVKDWLSQKKLEWRDMGASSEADGDDYPDFVLPAAELTVKDNGRAIIACRNGQGAAIAANKVKGARAAVCWSVECARTSRTDDDSNILSLPADYLTNEQILAIVEVWLETDFSLDARHLRRLKKIHQYEREG